MTTVTAIRRISSLERTRRKYGTAGTEAASVLRDCIYHAGANCTATMESEKQKKSLLVQL